ncbi:sugar phosphate nucleotidyltransferase [Mycolicibacterium sp. 624]|uniref:nucleotidyltransferase family protein n=1 Tax=Mycolicibacterium sp. 624 TaxID=3156314 RepID=UPI0033947DE1
MDQSVVALVPAAGRGTRLPEYSPKELAPIHAATNMPIIGFTLSAVAQAGVEECIIVTSDDKDAALKSEIGDGKAYRIRAHYVVQAAPRGLADTVVAAADSLDNRSVLFAMPDTVFWPVHSLSRIQAVGAAVDADVVLGVFPTSTPEALAPVVIGAHSQVTAALDKPADSGLRNTWGVLWWRPAFTEICVDWSQSSEAEEERTLSDAINFAIEAGLRIVAETFDTGFFCDGGTPTGLERARNLYHLMH